MTSALYNRVEINVWTKATWSAAWTLRPTLTAVNAVHAAQPETSIATFLQHYGAVLLEGQTAFAKQDTLDLSDQYVMIGTPGATVRWVGVIPQTAYALSGHDAEDPTGEQFFTAYGLEYLLGRIPVDHAFVSQGNPTDGYSVVQIGRCPTFNVQHQVGGTLIGNRSYAYLDGVPHFACADAAAMMKWSVKDILQYLLARFPTGGPAWGLSGQINDLGNYEEVVDLAGLSLRQAIDRLVDRRRGYSWCVRCDGTGAAYVHIFSIFDAAITVGSWTFSANTDVVSIDASSAPDMGEVQVREDRTAYCDRVRVQGAPIRSCFSVSIADETLAPAWRDWDEMAYVAGAKDESGYSDLTRSEKAYVNDKLRAGVALRRVFSAFRLPIYWDWRAGDGLGSEGSVCVAPEIDAETGAILPETPAEYWNFGHPLESHLPLREGSEYNKAGFPTVLPTGAEARFLTPFAVIRDRTGNWAFTHKMGDPHYPDFTLSPSSREMLFTLTAKPPHILAKNHWPDATAEPSYWVPGMDYETMIATISIRTDKLLEIVAEPTTPPSAEYTREALIRLPHCELWIVWANTVVDVDAAGVLQRVVPDPDSSGLYAILRDDRDRMRVVAALAKAWYCTPRTALSVEWRRIGNPGCNVGYMVSAVSGGTSQGFVVNSVVTKVAWDFATGRTRIDAGWWDVDWARVAPLNLSNRPDLRGLASDVDRIGSAVDALMQQETGDA